jgi:hypothetical protein
MSPKQDNTVPEEELELSSDALPASLPLDSQMSPEDDLTVPYAQKALKSTIAYNDEFFGIKDTTERYDSEFLGGRAELVKSADSWNNPGATPESTSVETSELVKESLGKVKGKDSNEKPPADAVVSEAPRQLFEGENLATYPFEGTNVAVSHFSNADCERIPGGEEARCTITGIRLEPGSALDLRMSEITFDTNHDLVEFSEISEHVVPKDMKKRLASAKEEKSLTLNYDVKKEELTCESVPGGPMCFLVTSKAVFNLSSADRVGKSHKDFNSGSRLVVLSRGIMLSLLGDLTMRAYEGPVLYKSGNPTFAPRDSEPETAIPDAFIDDNITSILEPIISEVFSADYSNAPPHEDTPEKALSIKLFEIYKKAHPQDDKKWKNLNSDSFAIFQIP